MKLDKVVDVAEYERVVEDNIRLQEKLGKSKQRVNLLKGNFLKFDVMLFCFFPSFCVYTNSTLNFLVKKLFGKFLDFGWKIG